MNSGIKKLGYGIIFGVFWTIFSWSIYLLFMSTTAIIYDQYMNPLWIWPAIKTVMIFAIFLIIYVKFCKNFISNLFLIPNLIHWFLMVYSIFVANQIVFFKIMCVIGLLVHMIAFIIVFKKTLRPKQAVC